MIVEKSLIETPRRAVAIIEAKYWGQVVSVEWLKRSISSKLRFEAFMLASLAPTVPDIAREPCEALSRLPHPWAEEGVSHTRPLASLRWKYAGNEHVGCFMK